jgi:L,D-transpeptidase-like protein/putative peptidoglycan binding protein
MPTRVLALACAIFLLAAAPALAQTQKRIRAGVGTAGVDLSGLTVEEAAARLDATLGPRLAPDMVVTTAGRLWPLPMASAQLRLDSVRTAKRALYSRAPVTEVPPAIVHSRTAVKAWVEDLAAKVRRAPRDATIRITVRRIFRERARLGKGLDVAAVRAAVDGALADPAAPRALRFRLATLRPRINADDLARTYGTVLTIDRPTFTLRLFKRLRFSRSYRIAVGMAGFDTPAGRYAIQDKQVDPAWHAPDRPWAGSLAGTTVPGGAPNNPLKARWMGIANGVGIHGTGEPWSIGTRASHGCIRMRVPDVIDLFGRVPVGTTVLIR